MTTFIMGMAFSQTAGMQDLKDYFKTKGEAYLKVAFETDADLLTLAQISSIDEVEGNIAYLYFYERGLEKFEALNLDFEILVKPGELYVPLMYSGAKENYEWDTYPTYETYISIMEQFAVDYPEICQVFSIGNSVQGRELKFVKISDNVSTPEAEPQFMYTGTIHGDETTGFILLLRLIDYLTSNYGTDTEVTDMVNNIEIWINPASNPDGTYHGGNQSVFGAQRANANNVDMNRNYKDAQWGDHPDGNPWQPETILFMALAEQTNFVMSANTHGGEEVVNYPWDVWSRLAADDEWWRLVSHEYADTCHAFAPSNYMNGFDNGITNGYAWYTINGGRQDFMNYFHQCREVTLEISDIKLIPESQLEAHWIYNKRSLINYIKQVYYGVRGLVTDSLTGEPLVAKVEALGHDEDESHVYSRQGLGNYHRLLKEGTYDLKFTADGYIPKTFYDVSVEDYDSTVLNVQLVSASLIADFIADQTNISLGSTVHFTQQCYGSPDSYEWVFEGGEPATSTLANPEVIYNETGAFNVTLTITKDDNIQTITKEDFIRVNEEYLMTNGEIVTCSGLFMDSSGNGDYLSNLDYTFTIYGDPTMTNTVLLVEFDEFSIEPHENCSYDYLKIYNGPNTNANLIGTFCGTNNPGKITANNDNNALTFVFHSDNSVVAPGWKATINCTIVDQINDVMNESLLKISPNPVADKLLTIEAPEKMSKIALYSVSGQLIGEWMCEQKKQTIELNSLESGIYLLSVHTEKGIYNTKIQVQ